MNTEDNRKEFYGLGELAQRWGTTYRNLHRQAKAGKIPTVKLGGLVKVRREHVEKIETHGF
jgi:excisionase family DNA binding protein